MLISECLWVLAVVATPAGQIDQLLSQVQDQQGVPRATLCSDDAFLRRISLDLIGRIPARDELLTFRAHPDRAAKIDELLNHDEFPRFWADVWTASLVGYQTRRFNASREPLRAWIEKSFAEGVPYDEMARQLIAAEGDSAFDGPVNFLLRHRQEPAVKVSRMFLGVRLDCARCHDHPFDRWTQEDFTRFSAFFQSVQFQSLSPQNFRLTERRRTATEEDLPRFLTGAQPRTSRWRDELALFITTCKPFARNFGNRVWYQLMGRGIVDPPDDFVQGAAVAPELLDHLAERARQSQFDLRVMIREICNSRAYQRSLGRGDESPKNQRLFASYLPKPMMPEQWLRSLETALGTRWSPGERNRRFAQLVNRSLDTDFSQTWEYRDTVQDLMSQLTQDHLTPDTSVTSIYEKILTRSPNSREIELCRDQPRSKIVFALINSNEFRFNH